MPGTDRTLVRNWLKALGALCAASLPIAEAEARVAAYVPMLGEQFDAGAFCQRSLEAVARKSKFFPSYAEVVERLEEWVDTDALRQRYAHRRIGTDRPRELTKEQHEHVDCVVRRIEDGGDPRKAIGVLHGVSGKHAVAALVQIAPQARALCEARGWLPSISPQTRAEQAGGQNPDIAEGRSGKAAGDPVQANYEGVDYGKSAP